MVGGEGSPQGGATAGSLTTLPSSVNRLRDELVSTFSFHRTLETPIGAACSQSPLMLRRLASPPQRRRNDFHSYAAHVINDVPARRAAITERLLSL